MATQNSLYSSSSDNGVSETYPQRHSRKMTHETFPNKSSSVKSHASANIVCIVYDISLHMTRKAQVTCNFNCAITKEGCLEVTDSEVQLLKWYYL